MVILVYKKTVFLRKDIDEHNFCKYNINTKETALVQWFKEHAAFMLYNKSNNKVYFLYDNDFNNIEVIGNICDNPELLEKGE